jgi:hypothetical protein
MDMAERIEGETSCPFNVVWRPPACKTKYSKPVKLTQEQPYFTTINTC